MSMLDVGVKSTHKLELEYTGHLSRAPWWVRNKIAPWYRRFLVAPLTVYTVCAAGLVTSYHLHGLPAWIASVPAYVVLYHLTTVHYRVWLIDQCSLRQKENEQKAADL